MIEVHTLLQQIEDIGIELIAGVPDSTLKPLCDRLRNYQGNLKHYVTANEGAAVGMAVGSYLATGKPACVYMQNSGIGNMVNPFTSLVHADVYGIPMLFFIGWRGEPGVRDEPQHIFQGKITCPMLDVLEIAYAMIDNKSTETELEKILQEAKSVLANKGQFALVVKKDAITSGKAVEWDNGNYLVRERVLTCLLEMIPTEMPIISTTGKISRELYDNCNHKRGNHNSIFMTVGGMGHASMIALGICEQLPDRKVVCIEGDGAVLMHMGAVPFIASHAPENFVHIVLNNMAHESVGAIPTDCQDVNFSEIAKAAGYVYTERVRTEKELERLKNRILLQKGPIMFEIMVSLTSRFDLPRPIETAYENKRIFMKYLGVSTNF